MNSFKGRFWIWRENKDIKMPDWFINNSPEVIDITWEQISELHSLGYNIMLQHCNQPILKKKKCIPNGEPFTRVNLDMYHFQMIG